MQESESNKRIAKNTVVLFLRMIVVMSVSLFTSRVVLQTLGVDDYGVYSVVGGLVAMFSTISGPITNAISRFLTFELGKNDKEKLARVFSTSILVQIILSVVVLLLAEIGGLWFLNCEMNIDPSRIGAANWVFQCSIVSFVVGLISSPYNAAIIAHERMSIFAYMTILDVLLKLGIVYALYLSGFDKLITYAILLVVVGLLMRVVYGIYCKRNFEECTWHLTFDKQLVKEMCSFAGWNFFGNITYVLNTQGVNMLINIFFGVAFNAARGIAQQVDAAVQMLVGNFLTALNPQITKSYASGDIERMTTLVNQGAKFAYFLMYLLVVPITLEADTILKIWLVEPPEHTTIFLRLVIYGSLTTLLCGTVYTAIFATGKIRRYEIEFSIGAASAFPLTWLGYYFGFPAEWAYVIYVAVYFCLDFVRLRALKRLVNFSIWNFVKRVMIPVGIVSVISYALPSVVVYCFEPSFWRIVLTTLVSVPFTFLCVWIFGMDLRERALVSSFAKRKLYRALK